MTSATEVATHGTNGLSTPNHDVKSESDSGNDLADVLNGVLEKIQPSKDQLNQAIKGLS